MEEKNKKKIFMISMSVLLILILVIGGTYAWFTLQLNGTKVNVLKAGSLSLILNDTNSLGVNSDKAVPMLDEVGETLEPYHFTLENNSDITSEYTIYLDDIALETDETRMNDSFVKYQLTKDGTKTTAKLNTIGEHPNRILDSGTIDGNTTITYDLRLWIDKDTENDAMGTTLRTKLRVVAIQSEPVVKTNKNILNVYSYSTDNATKCITGEEATCVELTERPSTYESGTIVKYKVNDTEEKYFHVISDNEDEGTLTMQQRENTIYATPWYETANDNSQGPLTILLALENATSGWTNVNNQTYEMGSTTFKTNPFTGCGYTDCTVNTYTLGSRIGKARMITVQETNSLGCQYNTNKSCPVWMNNYLSKSTDFGGTVNITEGEYGNNYGYWTMSAYSPNAVFAMYVYYSGCVYTNYATTTNCGARAVVEIDK